MCGRYTNTSEFNRIARLLDLHGDMPPFHPRYNSAPTQTVPVIVADESGRRVVRMMRWGLIPHWAKDADIGNRLINARAETITEKPAFRDAFRHRRCLVPADGFYEWKTEGKRKQPYYIRRSDGEPFAFAGLWETWTDPQDEVLDTFTIITTEPNTLLRPIHNRMPAILTVEQAAAWLQGDTEKAIEQLQPCDPDPFRADRVSKAVNGPANDSPDLIQPD